MDDHSGCQMIFGCMFFELLLFLGGFGNAETDDKKTIKHPCEVITIKASRFSYFLGTSLQRWDQGKGG